MTQSQFPIPSFWETTKAIAPEVWALSKFLWPLWLVVFIFAIFAIIKWKAEKWFDQKNLERVKKKCPDCAEWIPREAKKCSHCGKQF